MNIWLREPPLSTWLHWTWLNCRENWYSQWHITLLIFGPPLYTVEISAYSEIYYIQSMEFFFRTVFSRIHYVQSFSPQTVFSEIYYMHSNKEKMYLHTVNFTKCSLGRKWLYIVNFTKYSMRKKGVRAQSINELIKKYAYAAKTHFS